MSETTDPNSNPFAPPPSGDDDAPALGGSPPEWAKAHIILLGFILLALVIWLLSGFYKVNTGEVAVVERLGSFVRQAGEGQPVALMDAGLNYHLPYPIDVVYTVPMKQRQTLEVNDFNSSPASYEEYKKAFLRQGYPKEVVDAIFDPYLITGDKNLIHGALTLTYHVVNPESYLMCVRDNATLGTNRDAVVRQLAAHALIQDIARRPVDFILTGGVSDMQRSILEKTQRELDHVGLGVMIDQIQLTPPKPPAAVAEAFNEVLQARQDEERKKLDAETLKQSAITRATAEAQTILSAAKTYKQGQILEATGEASRFASVYARYKVAPDVTKANLFYDTMNNVLSGLNRLIWVKPGEETTIILDAPEPRIPPAPTGSSR
jgi:modulator of FtsH protease HflK